MVQLLCSESYTVLPVQGIMQLGEPHLKEVIGTTLLRQERQPSCIEVAPAFLPAVPGGQYVGLVAQTPEKLPAPSNQSKVTPMHT